jgi:tetratricopeptide (TPR) repeat protein
VFSNDLLLYGDAVSRQPHAAYAQTFLALTLAESADVLEMSGSPDETGIRNAREEALEHVNAALLSPDFARMIDPGRIRILQGALHERLGHDAQALALLHDALLLPQKPYNRLLGALAMARLKLRAGQPEEALRWTDRGLAAIGGATASPEALFLAGQCYEQMGQISAAVAAYKSIPRNSLAWGRAMARLGVLSPAVVPEQEVLDDKYRH